MSQPRTLEERIAYAQSLFVSGELTRAGEFIEQWLAEDDSEPAAWFARGMWAHLSDDLEQALESFQRSAEIHPLNAQAHAACGGMLALLGRSEEALVSHQRAVAVSPNSAALFVNLGIGNEEVGRNEDALEAYRRALDLEPDNAAARRRSILLLARTGAEHDAIELLRRDSERFAQDPEHWLFAAEVHMVLADFEQALSSLERLHALAPDSAPGWLQRALALAALGRIEESRDAFERAMSDPQLVRSFAAERRLALADGTLPQPLTLFLWSAFRRLQNHDWSQFDADGARIERHFAQHDIGFASGDALALRAVGHCFRVSEAARVACATHIARELRGQVAPRLFLASARAATGPLPRLGLVSARLADPEVARQAHALVDALRARDAEVHTFDLSPETANHDVGALIERSASQHHALAGTSDGDAAFEIYSAGIDLLLDLDGLHPRGRPAMMALRPAELHVAVLGYVGSLGGELADYVVTDAVSAAEDRTSAWRDRIIVLPAPVFPLPPTDDGPAPPREHLGLASDAFVMCAFTDDECVDPHSFEAWMRVLATVPRALLWLRHQAPAPRRRLELAAMRAGVEPARLRFAAPTASRADERRWMRRADVYLDTLHGSDPMSLACALAVGLPAVTVHDGSMAGAFAAALSSAHGGGRWEADDLAAYERHVLELATCADRVHPSTSIDWERQAGWLWRGLERAWRQHSSGDALADIVVEVE